MVLIFVVVEASSEQNKGVVEDKTEAFANSFLSTLGYGFSATCAFFGKTLFPVSNTSYEVPAGLINAQEGMQKAGQKEAKTENAIHFIWIGGKIKADYLKNIKECAAKAKIDNYVVSLWVDHPNNYWQTAMREDNEIPGLQIRHINDLLPGIKKDYDESTAKSIVDFIRREMVGRKNLAAASDLLRCIVLQQDKGFYFDTDLSFTVGEGGYTSRFLRKGKRQAFWESQRIWDKSKPRADHTRFKQEDVSKSELKMFENGRNKLKNNCMLFAKKGRKN